MRTSTLCLTLFACCLSGQAFSDGHLVPSTTDTQNVYWFADATDTGGKSHLTRTDGMILATLEAANLKPGDAYTLWWVVFNMPENCSHPGGEDDIFNPDGSLNEQGIVNAGIAIGNASGNIVKSDGTLEFGGRLPKGTNNPGHQVLFGAGFDEVMLVRSPHYTEVHLIVQTHGKGRGGPPLLKQLSMVNSNCTPRCADLQFSVHVP